jgi:hypothetical protein
MPSFDTNPMNIYLIIVFSLAVMAVVVSIGVAATWIVRHPWIRRTRAGSSPERAGARSQPTVDVQGRRPDQQTSDDGGTSDPGARRPGAPVGSREPAH